MHAQIECFFFFFFFFSITILVQICTKDDMNSHRLMQACTLLSTCSYSFSLALVLLAIGVQLEVFLVLTWSPGLPSHTVNFTDAFSGITKG